MSYRLCSCWKTCRTITILATVKKKSPDFPVLFLFDSDRKPAEGRGDRFCSLGLGEAFFPKLLFNALGLKLTPSPGSYFLEDLGIERDFSDEMMMRETVI